MDDTQHHDDFPQPNFDQICELAGAIREVFGGRLPRAEFAEKLQMFLENVPGFESGEVAVALVELAWAEYTNRRDKS